MSYLFESKFTKTHLRVSIKSISVVITEPWLKGGGEGRGGTGNGGKIWGDCLWCVMAAVVSVRDV